MVTKPIDEEELWAEIRDFEGIYSISNFGRVKSHKRVSTRSGNPYIVSERILRCCKLTRYDCAPFLGISLKDSDKRVQHVIRRLVAEAFLGIAHDDKVVITHADDDYTNCYYKNLIITSRRDYYSNLSKLNKILVDRNKTVYQKDLNTGVVVTFDSLKDAAKNGKCTNTAIRKRIIGGMIVNGLRWSYIPFENITPELEELYMANNISKRCRQVYCKDINTEERIDFASLKEASSFVGCRSKVLARRILTNPVISDLLFDYVDKSYHSEKSVCRISNRSPERALEEINSIHNHVFDFPYILKEYTGTDSVLTGICPIHGEFKTTFKYLYNDKKGCGKCRGKRSVFGRVYGKENGLIQMVKYYHQIRLENKRIGLLRLLKVISFKITIKDKDDIMHKTRAAIVADELGCIFKIYGDSYTLPKFNKEYHGRSSNNLTVICPIHGKFNGSVSALLVRSGCPECGKLRRTISRRASNIPIKDKGDYSFSELMNLYNFIRYNGVLLNTVSGKDDYEKGAILYDLYRKSLVKNITKKQATTVVNLTKEQAAIVATNVLIDKIKDRKNKNKNSPVTTLADVATINDRRNDPQLALKVIKRVHSDSFEFPKFESEYKTNTSVLTAICVMPGHGNFQTTLANISNLRGCPKCVGMLNDLAGKFGNSIKARLELQKIYRAERLRQYQEIEDKRKLALKTQTEPDASAGKCDDSVNLQLEPVLSFTDRLIADSVASRSDQILKQVAENPGPTISLISKPFDINNTGFERETPTEVFSVVERPVVVEPVIDEKEATRIRHALQLLALFEKYDAQGCEMVFKKGDKEFVVKFNPN